MLLLLYKHLRIPIQLQREPGNQQGCEQLSFTLDMQFRDMKLGIVCLASALLVLLMECLSLAPALVVITILNILHQFYWHNMVRLYIINLKNGMHMQE